MTFHEGALLLTAVWLAIVAVRYRRSTIVLVGGLVAIGLFTAGGLARGAVTPRELGLSAGSSWLPTIAFALLWLGMMLAYSPLADRIASRFIAKPPTLKTFRAIQQSRTKLVGGIAVAWALGGFLEELVFRGVVLKSITAILTAWVVGTIAAGAAIVAAAIGAGIIHLYQGNRAALIITQLSVLFGALFVFSGYNLWAVILCHGLYDTVAFIRFASGKSRYSDLSA
jgi:membrane protease YdiL (CAAX protease family)